MRVLVGLGPATEFLHLVNPKAHRRYESDAACAGDSFDPFNFFNIDTFDSWRSSAEDSATYSTARLALSLPLSDA
jgi:hypothetical protein